MGNMKDFWAELQVQVLRQFWLDFKLNTTSLSCEIDFEKWVTQAHSWDVLNARLKLNYWVVINECLIRLFIREWYDQSHEAFRRLQWENGGLGPKRDQLEATIYIIKQEIISTSMRKVEIKIKRTKADTDYFLTVMSTSFNH